MTPAFVVGIIFWPTLYKAYITEWLFLCSISTTASTHCSVRYEPLLLRREIDKLRLLAHKLFQTRLNQQIINYIGLCVHCPSLMFWLFIRFCFVYAAVAEEMCTSDCNECEQEEGERKQASG